MGWKILNLYQGVMHPVILVLTGIYIYKLKSPASPVEKKNWKKNIFKKFEKKYFRFVYICNCMSDHNSWTLGPIILKFWLGNLVEPPPTVPRPGLLFAWSKKVKCMTSIFYLWLILNLKKKHTQGFSSLLNVPPSHDFKISNSQANIE